MVCTRSQKRKLIEDQNDIDDDNTKDSENNIKYHIRKKQHYELNKTNIDNTSQNSQETIHEETPEETIHEETIHEETPEETPEETCEEISEETCEETDVDNVIPTQITDKITETIKDAIQNILIKHSKKRENALDKSSDEDIEYERFNNIIESIYDGEFFDRVPLENRMKELKHAFSLDEIKELTKQLENIKFKYLNESPSIIDILKMNVSIEQKQKLLEKVHCLANAEVLTEEYNANLKFLMSNISNEQDPELMKLEENILKSSLNNGLTESYRTKILKSKMSFENKVIAYKKLEIMETYEETDTSEYAKYKAWMDSLLSVPFGVYNESGITNESSLEDIKQYIKHIRETLDKKLSFLEKPKDQIINIVTQMVRNPDVNINAIGLYGNPGLGKTAITMSIAEALGRPHATISLGGESDASSLTGHGFTYVGSGSGRLIDILRNTKTMNPIILVDELDKVSETHHGKEIIGTLIHLTDSTTNKRYNYDKYFSGIEFDLSKVLFIFTYNDPNKIDKILADRLFKIKVDNYNFKEKLEITNKHIIPYMLDKFKLNKDDIQFSEESIKYLVKSSKDNEGMRNIKLKIKIILSRINTLLLTNEEDNVIHLKYKKLYPYYKTLPVKIPEKHIDIFLDESITIENSNDPPPFMYT